MTRRRVAIAAATAVGLVVALWIATPFVLRAAVDRGLRDLGRHQDLVGTRGAIGHDGLLGIALRDLSITTRDAFPLLTLRRARVSPAFAWPPARIELEGLLLTEEGLAAYNRTVESKGRSWYRNAKSGVDRQNRNLHGATPTVHLRDVTIVRPAGTIHIPEGIATWSAPTPSKATLTFNGTATLTATTVPAPDPVAVPVPAPVPDPAPVPKPIPTTASLSIHVTQDAVTLRLSVSLTPTGSLAPSVSLATRRSPAPGWSTITSNEATWTGDSTASNELAKRLLGW